MAAESAGWWAELPEWFVQAAVFAVVLPIVYYIRRSARANPTRIPPGRLLFYGAIVVGICSAFAIAIIRFQGSTIQNRDTQTRAAMVQSMQMYGVAEALRLFRLEERRVPAELLLDYVAALDAPLGAEDFAAVESVRLARRAGIRASDEFDGKMLGTALWAHHQFGDLDALSRCDAGFQCRLSYFQALIDYCERNPRRCEGNRAAYGQLRDLADQSGDIAGIVARMDQQLAALPEA